MNFIKYALVRKPADTIAEGQTMHPERGRVDVARAKAQHKKHREDDLRWLEYILLTMDADSRFPDSVFPEDPGVILQNEEKSLLIITRLCKPKRQGEEAALENFLVPKHFSPEQVLRIKTPGFLEGGDVLVTDHALYVGISSRTNLVGIEQLAKIAREHFGLPTFYFRIPKDGLHLKGYCSYHSRQGTKERPFIMVAEQIAPHFEEGLKSAFGVKNIKDALCKLLVVPTHEHDDCYGANAISEGDKIIVHEGAAVTRRMLEKKGFTVREVDLREFWRIDGAMSCLSKLFVSSISL